MSTDQNVGEIYLQINVLAKLILSHLNDLQDTFEATMGSRDDQQLEIDMFHAINDLASAFYEANESMQVSDNVINAELIKRYRKRLVHTWQEKSKLSPIPHKDYKIDIDKSVFITVEMQAEIKKIDVRNKLIADNILLEFQKLVYRSRWKQVTALVNEIKFFHKYHLET